MSQENINHEQEILQSGIPVLRFTVIKVEYIGHEILLMMGIK